MPAPPVPRQPRREILRAVYEENLRVSEPAPHPRRERPRPAPRAPASAPARPAPRRHWTGWGALLMALFIVAAWGVQSAVPDPPAESGPAVEPGPVGEAPSAPAAAGLAYRAAERDPLLTVDPAHLPVADLFGLRISTIVIDPGHGGRDPGAVGPSGTLEKDLTLDLALRLRDRLRDRGYRVLLTRTADEALSLRERVTFANRHGADLFVSLHLNSIPDPDAAPIETYYFGLRADAATLQLAHGENAAGDFSVAEFNQLMQRAGSTLKFQESRELAEALQERLLQRVRGAGTRASDWGVKAGPFVVLLGVEAPAVLAE
ncbi:MAG: N-acetylmuramoyl-L-alanine amidase, partial [Rhodothermales bacterium]|nr:N-acetylmuramoyl-L-alanine amidase [Rhodothermales bacterium]